jgi:hypothetical protein
MVDQRFGHGTWQSIINERARRIQEAKEIAKKERIEQNRKNHEIMELAKTIGISVMAVIFAVSCIALSMMFAGP